MSDDVTDVLLSGELAQVVVLSRKVKSGDVPVQAGDALIDFRRMDQSRGTVVAPRSGYVTYSSKVVRVRRLQGGDLVAKISSSPISDVSASSSAADTDTSTSQSLLSSGSDSASTTTASCTHAIVCNDMCANCGMNFRNRPSETNVVWGQRVSMVHHVPGLHVSADLANELGKIDQATLLDDRRLVLLCDLDQTLVHSTNRPPVGWTPEQDKAESANPERDLFHFVLWNEGHWTKLRPGTRNFLKRMNELYELHIVTFGCRQYAHKIAELLDPTRTLFGQRILSRNELLSDSHKTCNLQQLFPRGEKLIAILDDRADVWQHMANVLHIRAFRFFPDIGDMNAPTAANPETAPSSAETTITENDNMLEHAERVLRRVHSVFFERYEQQPQDLPDVKSVMADVRRSVLSGLNIVLSGIVPMGAPPESAEFYRISVALGAVVQTDVVAGKTTHVVAAKWGTQKVIDAFNYGNIHIVSPDWLKRCFETWTKADETEFVVQREKERPQLNKSASAPSTSALVEGATSPTVDADCWPSTFLGKSLISEMDDEVNSALSEDGLDEEDDDDDEADDDEERRSISAESAGPSKQHTPAKRPSPQAEEDSERNERKRTKLLKRITDPDNGGGDEGSDDDDDDGYSDADANEESENGDDDGDSSTDDDLAAEVERQLAEYQE